MNIEQPKNPYEGMSEEEIEMYEQYMANHPEVVTPEEQLRSCESEVAGFENLIGSFETKHNLQELYAITELSPDEAPNHPTREPARKDLIPIKALLDILKQETNITEEKHDELLAKYRNISRAVGMINNGKVDHTR